MDYIAERVKQLQAYLPDQTKQPDFDAFWSATIDQTRSIPLRPSRKAYPFPSRHVECFDISYRGFDETEIHGWFLVPKFGPEGKKPCLIHHHGYTATRGRPADHLSWVMMGLCVLVPDHRDQTGTTGESGGYSSGHAFNTYSKGLLDKNEYFLRRLYMDALKAIDFAVAQDEVDPSRIIVEGGSMGGGISLAVCALDQRSILCLPDVASSCHLDHRTWNGSGSFASVQDYLRHHPDHTEKAFETLSYFDAMNITDRIKVPVFASVGLKDNICPPETVFAAYNRILSEKHMEIYPFNGHEGGGSLQHEKKMRFVARKLGL
jgi:cephalosporin-C deacetylase